MLSLSKPEAKGIEPVQKNAHLGTYSWIASLQLVACNERVMMIVNGDSYYTRVYFTSIQEAPSLVSCCKLRNARSRKKLKRYQRAMCPA